MLLALPINFLIPFIAFVNKIYFQTKVQVINLHHQNIEDDVFSFRFCESNHCIALAVSDMIVNIECKSRTEDLMMKGELNERAEVNKGN